jgi:hypothetical protein
MGREHNPFYANRRGDPSSSIYTLAPSTLPLTGSIKLGSRAGKARDLLMMCIARGKDFLREQTLNLPTGLPAIKENGAPTLPICHFVTFMR